MYILYMTNIGHGGYVEKGIWHHQIRGVEKCRGEECGYGDGYGMGDGK